MRSYRSLSDFDLHYSSDASDFDTGFENIFVDTTADMTKRCTYYDCGSYNYPEEVEYDADWEIEYDYIKYTDEDGNEITIDSETESKIKARLDEFMKNQAETYGY